MRPQARVAPYTHPRRHWTSSMGQRRGPMTGKRGSGLEKPKSRDHLASLAPTPPPFPLPLPLPLSRHLVLPAAVARAPRGGQGTVRPPWVQGPGLPPLDWLAHSLRHLCRFQVRPRPAGLGQPPPREEAPGFQQDQRSPRWESDGRLVRPAMRFVKSWLLRPRAGWPMIGSGGQG